MFSPKRSSDRKVDKKAMRERFKQMSDIRDNNIKLNILGVPKEQVSFQKTHQESKNENIFKISIDTQNKRGNNRRDKVNSLDDTTSGFDQTFPLKKDHLNDNVCLNLPGEKKRDIQIIRQPSDEIIRDSPNHKNMQSNVQPESIQKKIFLQSKEPADIPQIDHDQITSPDSDIKKEDVNNIRKSMPVHREEGKPESKEVGFADYDALYVTGSEESIEDKMPFDKRSPMMYRVGDDTPQGKFDHAGSKNGPDPNVANLDSKGITQQPLRTTPYNNMLEPSESTPDQEGQPSHFVSVPKSKKLNITNNGGNFTPHRDLLPKEDPSLKGNIKKPSHDKTGTPYSESHAKNVTKPLKVDRESMTDNPSPNNKGNISNIRSHFPEKLPLSPSEESTHRNRPSYISRSRKSLITSIPKPNFSAFRRQKSPKSFAGQENVPDLISKTSSGISKSDIDRPSKETVHNLSYKTPRKLTPINLNGLNFKPVFFAPDASVVLGDQNKPPQQHPGNVTDGQLQQKKREEDENSKKSSINTDKKKTDGNSQTLEDEKASQTTANSERSSMSIILSESTVIDHIPEKRSVEQEDNGYADFINQNPSLGVHTREHDSNSVPVDNYMEKDVFKSFNLQNSVSNIIDSSQESINLSGKVLEGKVMGSKSVFEDEGSIGSSYEISSSTYPSRVVSVDSRTIQSNALPLNKTPSTVIEQLANIFMDGKVIPWTNTELKEDSIEKESSSSTFKPIPTASLQDLTQLPEGGVDKSHSGTTESEGLNILSGLHPNDYLSLNTRAMQLNARKSNNEQGWSSVGEILSNESTRAIPRTASVIASNQGLLQNGKGWPSVGERLSKRGSPSIETIKEEGTDEMEAPSPGPSNITDPSSDGCELTPDIGGTKYSLGEGNKNIDKDRTNIIAYPGHLVDSTPFEYNPSGQDAYPLENKSTSDTRHKQPNDLPVNYRQFHEPAAGRDVATRRPDRKSKTIKQRHAPGRVRKRSGSNRDAVDGAGNELGVFGQGPENKLIYLGKIPNTTYNVFYSPDERRAPENTESETIVVNPKGEKMVWDMPKGILIFVHKKNDHTFPFKNGNQVENISGNKGKHNYRDDSRTVGPRENGPRPKRASTDAKVTVERTPGGKSVKEEYPCGCYRVATFDLADVLQDEAFVSAECAEGSVCEVAHPELAPPQTDAYAPPPTDSYAPREAAIRKRPSGDTSGRRHPGVEVIAEGVVSRNAIKPRPPSRKMKGADLFASLNFKSNKLDGMFHFYFDPKLKRYLRENLTEILEEGDKTRRRRVSH